MTGEQFVETQGKILKNVTGGIGIKSGVPAITTGIIQRKHSGLVVVEQVNADPGVIAFFTGTLSGYRCERLVAVVSEVPIGKEIEVVSSQAGGGLGWDLELAAAQDGRSCVGGLRLIRSL